MRGNTGNAPDTTNGTSLIHHTTLVDFAKVTFLNLTCRQGKSGLCKL